MIALADKHKKWLKWAGYPLFAVVAFVYALHLSFPYGRIEQRLQEMAGDGFDVTVDSAGPGWFPGDVVMKGVTFKTRPLRDDEKAVELTIDRLDIDIGLVAAATGSLSVDIEAKIAGGVLEGSVRSSKDETRLALGSRELPMGNLPGIRTATGGVPMEGGVSIAMNVTLPKGKWRDANGSITLDCEGCTIGDGKAKIRPQAPGMQNAFSEGGFTLPKLKLGKLGGKIAIAKGLGKFEDFAGKSPDGELLIEGDIRFEDPVAKSQVTAYMRFKANDELMKREPKMGDIVMMMKGQSLRPDGYMGVRVTGALNALRFLGSKTSPVPTKEKEVGGLAGKPPRPAGLPGSASEGVVRPEITLPPGTGLPPPSPSAPVGSTEVPPPPPPPSEPAPPVPVPAPMPMPDGTPSVSAPPTPEIQVRPSDLRVRPIDDVRPVEPPPPAQGEVPPPPVDAPPPPSNPEQQ